LKVFAGELSYCTQYRLKSWRGIAKTKNDGAPTGCGGEDTRKTKSKTNMETKLKMIQKVRKDKNEAVRRSLFLIHFSRLTS